MKQFNERLKELRLQKHYTQKQVADDLKMTVSALSQYENGKRTPKNSVLIRLAKYYNVSSDYILGMDDMPSKEYTPLEFDTPVAASSSEYVYNADRNSAVNERELNSSKARVLQSINRLPKAKQVEVLSVIELLLGTIIND
ncbi:MAG: helix-turn-helix domain-containing protein [Clostridia bacterium]|nr:helix-turn-helix domain-containing protein [Clostridia bacterium]